MMLQSHEQRVKENTDGDEGIKQREADYLFQHFLQLDKGRVRLGKPETTSAIPLMKKRLLIFLHIYI